MNFQTTQYYPQDWELSIYPSRQMHVLYWRVHIGWQQILLGFSTLEKRKMDTQNLCKLDAETVNLSIAFILYLRLTASKTIVAEEWKLWRSTFGLYKVSKVSGLVIHHLLNCVISWTCHHQWPKMNMIANLIR